MARTLPATARSEIPLLLPLLSLPFVDGDNICILPLLRDFFMLPDLVDKEEKCMVPEVASLFEDLCRDTIRARGLVAFQ